MSYTEERVSEAWSSNHAHLTNLAFGILGDLGAAEDAVQEAFARLVVGQCYGCPRECRPGVVIHRSDDRAKGVLAKRWNRFQK